MKKGKDGFYARYIKRILDIVLAFTALVLLSWLYAILAVKVRRNLGSPVLFTQPRPGKGEKIFWLYKFRSMTDERDAHGNLLPDEQRLTAFGSWLRRSSMDELPQLWNVLRGDMSLLGPRPQLVRDMVFMTPEQRRRHSVRPGISGLAQVSGRNALEWERKLEKDIEYVDNISFGMDISIIIKTVSQVIFRKKGMEDSNIDEVDLTDDYGVFLLKNGIITQTQFDEGMLSAARLLGEAPAEQRVCSSA